MGVGRKPIYKDFIVRDKLFGLAGLGREEVRVIFFWRQYDSGSIVDEIVGQLFTVFLQIGSVCSMGQWDTRQRCSLYCSRKRVSFGVLGICWKPQKRRNTL